MRSSPPRDRQAEARFLAWLAEREPVTAGHAATDLDTLCDLGGLEREGAAFAETLTGAGLDDERTERLLHVHAAWTRFRRREREAAGAVSWVGRSSDAAPDEAVTWVEAEAPAVGPAPSGAVPSLLAPGAGPVRPDVPGAATWRVTDLVVPLLLVASVLLLLVPVARERLAIAALRAEAVALLESELSSGARPERLQLQADRGSWLAELRSGQLRIVNATCEGGAWCRSRVNSLAASERTARELVADARAHGARPTPDWRAPQDAYTVELARLQALLADPGGGWDARDLQQRTSVLRAEVDWVRSEASR